MTGRKASPEVSVGQGIPGTQALLRIVDQELLEEILRAIADVTGENLGRANGFPTRKDRFEIRELGHSGPDSFVGSPQGPEDPEELIDLAVAREKGTLEDHLGEDAPEAPDIDGHGVRLGSEENLWRSVPQGDDLVSVAPLRHREGSGQAEVSQLDDAELVEQQVLRLKVPVENSVRVAVGDAFEQLLEVALGHLLREAWTSGHGFEVVHEPLQVLIQILEDHVELEIAVDHVKELDNVGMVQLLQDADLANGGARDSLGLCLESNFLEGHQLTGHLVPRLVDDPVRPLPDFLNFLEVVHGWVGWLAEYLEQKGRNIFESRRRLQ